MHMNHSQPTFAFLVIRIRELYPRFAHLHVLEPRMTGSNLREILEWESNDFLRALWKSPDAESTGCVFLSAGGYTPESALEEAERTGDLIVFGRHFLSNVRIRFIEVSHRRVLNSSLSPIFLQGFARTSP